MIVKIVARKQSNFLGNDGEPVEYYWYTAVRGSDQVKFQFGSRDGSHEEGTEVDLELEKREQNNGKVGWREIV